MNDTLIFVFCLAVCGLNAAVAVKEDAPLGGAVNGAASGVFLAAAALFLLNIVAEKFPQ